MLSLLIICLNKNVLIFFKATRCESTCPLARKVYTLDWFIKNLSHQKGVGICAKFDDIDLLKTFMKLLNI